MGAGETALARLREGGKPALARALADLEQGPESDEIRALLDAAFADPSAHVLGLTGPPGVGKSTLLNRLIAAYRKQGRTVGVIAVDPSSRRTGGALLGDRTRLRTDPEDDGAFIRSMAARDRLGGLAGLTWAATILMRAIYDVVIIETVGVGQSETDIAGAADTIVFCVQPGSGDSLQFMKAGIVEVPQIVVVTKADMEKEAKRAKADVEGALSLSETDPDWRIPVLGVAALRDAGIEELIEAVDAHRTHLEAHGMLASARIAQAEAWLTESIRERYGREGLRRTGAIRLQKGESPFARLAEALARLQHDGT